MILRELISAVEVVSGNELRPTMAGLNMNPDKISPLVSHAMRTFVKPILSEELYNDLVDKRAAGDCNYLSDPPITAYDPEAYPDYEYFWKKYLYELCANAVMFMSAPFLAVQIGEIGIFSANDHNTTALDQEKAKFLQTQLNAQIETVQNEMIRYLNLNPEAFPLFSYSVKYVKQQTQVNKDKDKRSANIIGGIVFSEDPGYRY